MGNGFLFASALDPRLLCAGDGCNKHESYSKTGLKRPLKNRQNNGLNGKK